MALLEKIRVKFGIVISVIIALALLSFIIDPGTLESALNSMSSKYDVGKIDGKRISYNEFQSEIDKYTAVNELLTGSSAQSEQMQEQIRNSAWQELVDKYMFIPNAQSAGIQVGEAELVDLVSGENISPVMSQNPVFLDESGNFSLDNLNAFIANVNQDQSGRLRLYWNFLQNGINTQQYYQKYNALFSAGNYENALQLAEDLNFNNTTADVDYCLTMYPVVRDSSVTVSDAEIKSYYDSHKDFFKQRASREIEYVVYEVEPSEADVLATSDEMDAAYEEFKTTDNMRAFLLRNSDEPLSEYWYKAGDLNTVNRDINRYIFEDGEDITPIIKSGDTFIAARELDSKMLPDSVFVKHILIQGEGAEHVADSLVGVLNRGGNFSNLAAIYSADQSSAADGELGSIGWMTQSYLIPGFESVIEARVDRPFVLNTQYGSHVVLVTERTRPVLKKQVALLEKTAIAGRDTFNEYYAQANTFSTLAGGSYDGYRKAVDSTKVYSHSLTITEATSSYGAIDNAKEVTRWAFDAKAGKASEIITVNNNYFFIATVKKINKEGYAPVSDVASMIEQRLYTQKLQEKTLAEVKGKLEGITSLEDAAKVLGVEVERSEGLSLASTSTDPALLGAAQSAPEGTLCGPVAGTMGVYVLNVSNRQTGSFYTEDDARNLAAQKAQYSAQLILTVMADYDDVVDNRARFF